MLRHHFTQTLKSLDGVIRFFAETIERFFEVLLVVAIGVVLAPLNFVQRRTCNIDVATLHKFALIAVEEGENQRSDVSAIHISIGHDHDTVIAKIADIKFFALNAQTESRNQGLNLSIFVDLGVIRLLNVENLAPQGKNRLIAAIAALFGRATSRITLNDVDLRFRGITGAAIGELAGKG